MFDFLSEANWWCLLLLLTLAFWLGWILSKWASSHKYKSALDACEKEKNQLIKDLDPDSSLSYSERKKRNKSLNFNRIGKADPSKKDDLKQISGIGPFIEEKLNTIGIYTFDQISRFNQDDIDTVTELIQFFPGRIEKDEWTLQAKRLIKDQY